MTVPIVYKSYQSIDQSCAFSGTPKQLEKNSKDGLSWEWNYSEEFAPLDSWRKLEICAYLSWKFEWDEKEMQKNGVYGFEGMITVRNYKNDNSAIPLLFKINLIKSGECIKKRIGTVDEVAWSASNSGRDFECEFTLKKITKRFYNVYQNAEFADAVLVVDGVKINVNKNYLAIRSDYFNTMFNSEFKEKSMDEIPINDVKYQEFITFINVIHPTNPEPATDDNVEILLELADRFMMPAVTRQVEHNLLSSTEFSMGDALKLADKYKLEKLINKCLGMLKTIDQVKTFKNNSDYLNLSDPTQVKMLDTVMKILK